MGGGAAELVIDGLRHGFGAAEVGVVEQEGEVVAAIDVEGDAALDHRAEGDAGGVGVVVLLDVSVDVDGVSADDERALRLRVDLSVGSVEGRHEEEAAFETSGVARGGDGDVELGAGPGERRQSGGDKDGGEVLHADRRGGNTYAHAEQGGGEGLRGEGGLLAVAGALQADDDAVADELVVADALDRGDVFYARLPVGWRGSVRGEGHAPGQ